MSEETKELKEFTCWKCKILLFLYKIKLSVVINCPACQTENRAGAGSEDKNINKSGGKDGT